MSLMSSDVDICNYALSFVGHDKIGSLSEANKGARQCNLHYSNALESLLEKYDWNFARHRDRLTAAGILNNVLNTITITGNTAPTADTIVSDGGDGQNFTDSDVGFESGDRITITGSGSNNSTYEIDTASALTLTLEQHEDAVTESLALDADLKLFAVPGGSVYDYKYVKPSDCVIVRSVNEILSVDKRPYWDEEKTYIVTNEKDDNDQIDISYTQRITTVSKMPSVFITVLAYMIAIRIVMPLSNSRTLRADLVRELDDVMESAEFVSAWKGNPDTDVPDNAYSFLAGRS